MFRNRINALVIATVLTISGVLLATDEISTPFVGVTHIHRTLTEPRLLDINITIIDLSAPGIRCKVTPADTTSDNETKTQTVKNFLIEQNAQIAINAGFFYFNPNVDVMGFAASDGDNYSPFTSWYDFPTPHIALNVSEDNIASVMYPDNWIPAGYRSYPSNTPVYNAVPGSEWIVRHGVKNVGDYHLNPELHPRTAAGFTADNKLVLFVVDGRNAGHSLGMYTSEVADMLIELGCVEAINLDGGGSTTMVFADPYPRLVNVPVGTGAPYTERKTANNFAVYAIYDSNEPIKYKFADFENADESTFCYSPGYSGSTLGILDSQSTADAVDTKSRSGDYSQMIFIADDPAISTVAEYPEGGWFVRMVSGPHASPSENTERSVGGYAGFWAKTETPDIYVSLAIDNEDQMERGLKKSLINDGQWHVYEWNLDDDSQWQGWVNGDGAIVKTSFTIDSIQFFGQNADATVYIDDIMHSLAGSITELLSCQDVIDAGLKLPADLNSDCAVNMVDLKILAEAWLMNQPQADIIPPQGDSTVNFKDFSLIASQWLESNDPENQ